MVKHFQKQNPCLSLETTNISAELLFYFLIINKKYFLTLD